MDIQLVDYIGQLRNDTPNLGKGYIFNIIFNSDECELYKCKDNYSFDVMLFMHVDVSFISLHDDQIDLKIDSDVILNTIIEKYGKDKLL